MAKLVKLFQQGNLVYPQTITSAIADTQRGKLLTTIISNLEAAASSWTLTSASSETASGDGGTIVVSLNGKKYDYSTSAWTEVDGGSVNIAGDIYLENVVYSSATHELIFTYSTNSGKQAVTVSLDDLVDVYQGSDTIAITTGEPGEAGTHLATVSVKISETTNGNIISSTTDGLFATIAATGDTYVSASIDSTDKNKVVVAADVVATSGDIETLALDGDKKLADAYAIKEYVNAKVISAVTGAVGISSVTTDYLAVNKTANNQFELSAKTATIGNDATTSAVTVDETNGKTADAKQVADAVNGYVNKVSGDIKTTIDTLSANTKTAIEALDADVSGESNGVKVQVVQVDGEVTGVSVTTTTASTKSAVTDATALANAKDVREYVESVSASTIEGLDANVSSDTVNSIKVAVSEENGKVTGVFVSAVTASTKAAVEDATALANAKDVQEHVSAVSSSIITYVDSAVTNTVSGLDATVTGATDYIGITIEEADGKLTGVSLTNNVVATSEALSALTVSGSLADAKAVKEYVDAQVTGKNVAASSTTPAYITATAENNAIGVGAVTGDITVASGVSGTSYTITAPDPDALAHTTNVRNSIFNYAVTISDEGTAPEFTWPTE